MREVALFTDLHLGVHGNSEEWHQIALDWANWITEELKAKKIKEIFFLGDFFDNRTEVNVQTLHIASQIMEIFSDFQIKMIVGNHDAYYKNRSDVSSLGIHKGRKNVQVIDIVESIPFGNKECLFVPWNNEIPEGKYDYIFGHFEIQSYKMNNHHVCEKGLTPSELLSKSPFVFSGHFHNRSQGAYNEGKIYYIGNPFPMDFSDVGNPKGYYILDLDSEELEFFENDISPKFQRYRLSEVKKFDPNEIRNNFCKLIVDMDVDEKKLEKIEIALKKHEPRRLIIERNTVTRTINDVEEVDSVEIVEIVEEFIEKLELDEYTKTESEKVIADLYERCIL